MTDTTSSITETRLQLLRNGYTPLRNRAKAPLSFGWQALDVDERQIKLWERSRSEEPSETTGLRLDNGLMVIDIDVDDEATVAAINNIIFDNVPDLYDDNLLIRGGRGHREAWWFRVDPDNKPLVGNTTKYTSPDGDTHSVDFYTGVAKRQFGAFGVHSYNEDGSVARMYHWPELSPLDVPFDKIPILTAEQLTNIRDEAETVLRNREGWELVQGSNSDELSRRIVYDIRPDSIFHTKEHGELTLEQLRGQAPKAGSTYLQLSAEDWLAPSTSSLPWNMTRCWAHILPNGLLAIWDSNTDTSHREVAAAPEPLQPMSELVASLARKLGKVVPIPPAPIAKGDFDENLRRMLGRFVFNSTTGDVVELDSRYTTSKVPVFRQRCLQWNAPAEKDPKTNKKIKQPALIDVWLQHENLVHIKGMQFLPGQDGGIYTDEKNDTWLNTYREPVHPAAGGSASTGLQFMEDILPDTRERKWFMQWLAYKYQHPEVPGPGVIMLADDFGTGRGRLFNFIGKLFGEMNVKGIMWDELIGKDGQVAYNEWRVSSTVVTVDEASEASADGHRYHNQVAVYEKLKSIVDPEARLVQVHIKYVTQSFRLTCASFLIATNHRDAIKFPDFDRRFAVLTNGVRQEDGYFRPFVAWYSDPANVGAFARHLIEKVDLSDYDPYGMPIMTEAKRLMTELAKSEIDRAYEDTLANLQGECFYPEQIVDILSSRSMDGPAGWQGGIKRKVRTKCHRVTNLGNDYSPKIGSSRRSVYAKDKATALKWSADVGFETLRDEVLKNETAAITNNIVKFKR
jgi:hypothetical protein